MNMTTWLEFWERPNSIYVCERHRILHGHLIADSIVSFIRSPTATVLDYGCGEALAANSVAARCSKLILCDASRSLRSALEKRHAGHGKVKVIAPPGVHALPKESLDLIVMNSVIQYLSRVEFERLLDLIRPRLRQLGDARHWRRYPAGAKQACRCHIAPALWFRWGLRFPCPVWH